MLPSETAANDAPPLFALGAPLKGGHRPAWRLPARLLHHRRRRHSGRSAKVVRCCLDALARDDWTALIAQLDPDVELHEPDDLPDPRVFRGRNGLYELLTRITEQFDLVKVEAEKIAPVGNRVVVCFKVIAQGKLSGAPVEARHAAILTVRRGKICRIDGHTSWDAALAAARVS